MNIKKVGVCPVLVCVCVCVCVYVCVCVCVFCFVLFVVRVCGTQQVSVCKRCVLCKSFILAFLLHVYSLLVFSLTDAFFPQPIQCSAPEYVDYLMSWVQQQIDDEAIFPSELGVYVCVCLCVCVCL